MENEFYKKLFASRLKELRKGKNLTQDDVCDLTGLEISNYSKIETGKVAPSFASIQKLITKAGFVPNELFSYDHLDKEENLDKAIFEVYKRLSYSQKKLLYKILRGIEEYK